MGNINLNAFQAALVASQTLGVDANVLYGQFAGETGNFTNSGSQNFNYAGIQSPGQTTFSSPTAFGNYFAAQIQKNYPNAVGAGGNVSQYVAGLTNGNIGTYYAGNNSSGVPETQAMYQNLISANMPVNSTTGKLQAANNLLTGKNANTSNAFSSWSDWLSLHAGNWGVILLGGVLIVGALLIGNKDTIAKVAAVAAK